MTLFQQRKYSLTAFSLAALFISLWTGQITGDQATLLIPSVLAIFTGGNVVAKHNAFTEDK